MAIPTAMGKQLKAAIPRRKKTETGSPYQLLPATAAPAGVWQRGGKKRMGDRMNIRDLAKFAVWFTVCLQATERAYCAAPQAASPVHSRKLVELARQLLEQDDVKAAMKLLNEAISLDPRNEDAYVLRGDAHWDLRTFESIEQAIEDYSQAIAVNPRSVLAYRRRGDVRREPRISDHRGALADYDAALRIAPDDPVTLCHRGTLWRSAGRRDLARADFRRAIEIEAEHPQALNNLGYLAAQDGDLDTAISYYSKAIEAGPTYAQAYANRGYTLFKKKKFERAIRDLEKALELEPGDWMVLVDRGDTKAAMGDLPGAIADYTKAIEVHAYYAGVAGAYGKRGEVYKRLGEEAKADKDLERAKDFDLD
jgi:tetratricopeptide (TPR) repeat protein